MRMRNTSVLPLFATFVLTFGPLMAQEPSGSSGAEIAGAAAQPPDVSERIEVVEAQLLVELPRLGPKDQAKLRPEDFVVQEGGLQRTVTAVRKLDLETEPYTVLVYFDPLLAGPDTIGLAGFVLADHAEELAQLGPVRVVTSAPGTQEWLRPTRDAPAIAQALRSVGRSRIGRDGLATLRQTRDEAPVDILEEESFFLQERTDALLVEAAETCRVPPCLLVLVSEGFDTLPEASYPRAAVAEVEPAHAQIAEQAKELLAGMGWTVLALPLAESREREPTTDSAGPGTDYYAWKREAGGVQMPRPDKPGNRLSGLPTNALDVFVQARLQTLREWAAASVGAILRLPQQVQPELERLGDRLWITYRTDFSGPALRPLDVRFDQLGSFQDQRSTREALGFVPEDEPLRAPTHAAYGVPVALSDARVRSLAFGKRLVGALEVQPLDRGGRVIGAQWEGVSPEHLVRVSVIGVDGELSHRVETPSGEANHRLQLDGENTGWVLVENLRTREWGAVELAGGEGLLD